MNANIHSNWAPIVCGERMKLQLTFNAMNQYPNIRFDACNENAAAPGACYPIDVSFITCNFN